MTEDLKVRNSNKVTDGKIFVAASIKSRILAGAVDLSIIYLSVIMAGLLPYANVFGFENMFITYYMINFSMPNWSTTLGGRIFKIFIVKKDDRQISGVNKATRGFFCFLLLMVNIVLYSAHIIDGIPIYYFLGGLIFTIVILNVPMVFTKEKRSLIDLLSSTKVVKGLAKNRSTPVARILN